MYIDSDKRKISMSGIFGTAGDDSPVAAAFTDAGFFFKLPENREVTEPETFSE